MDLCLRLRALAHCRATLGGIQAAAHGRGRCQRRRTASSSAFCSLAVASSGNGAAAGPVGSGVEVARSKRMLHVVLVSPMGFIVDNLKLTDSVNKNRPRLNEYDMATLMYTICKAKDNGRISFENFKLKSLEEICYVQSSRFCIQSAVDSQDVRSAMATSAVVTSGVPESQEVIQSAVQILSSLQNPESFGVDQAQVDACIARLSALQPVGASCSNVGASCSISEAAEASSTKKADEEKAAEATSRKKADEEEIIALQPVGASCSNVGDSCSISEAANKKKAAEEEIIALQPVGASCSNVDASCSISEAAEAANTKKTAAAVPEAANTTVHEEGISKAAKSKSRATKKPAAAVPRRFSLRLNGAVEGGDVTSPIRKHPKRK